MIQIRNIKRLVLIINVFLFASLYSCKEIHMLDTKVYSEDDLYRPNFHFSPKKGWMNDPNGMFYKNGYYHLFFQYVCDFYCI